jgi:hypothetical protein
MSKQISGLMNGLMDILVPGKVQHMLAELDKSGDTKTLWDPAV